MPARAGKFRHKVTIQVATDTNNALGEPVQSWAAETTRRCKVSDIEGLENWRGQKVEAGVTVGVELRYLAGLTPKKRFVTSDNRTLAILSVLNPDGLKIEHVCQCKEEVL